MRRLLAHLTHWLISTQVVTTGNGATPLSFYEDSEASLAKALSYDKATWGVAARAALEVSLKLASSTDWLRDATPHVALS